MSDAPQQDIRHRHEIIADNVRLQRALNDAEEAMDEVERSSGDAPHRAVDLATRILSNRDAAPQERSPKGDERGAASNLVHPPAVAALCAIWFFAGICVLYSIVSAARYFALGDERNLWSWSFCFLGFLVCCYSAYRGLIDDAPWRDE
jgi:hypothetical protein